MYIESCLFLINYLQIVKNLIMKIRVENVDSLNSQQCFANTKDSLTIHMKEK